MDVQAQVAAPTLLPVAVNKLIQLAIGCKVGAVVNAAATGRAQQDKRSAAGRQKQHDQAGPVGAAVDVQAKVSPTLLPVAVHKLVQLPVGCNAGAVVVVAARGEQRGEKRSAAVYTTNTFASNWFLERQQPVTMKGVAVAVATGMQAVVVMAAVATGAQAGPGGSK